MAKPKVTKKARRRKLPNKLGCRNGPKMRQWGMPATAFVAYS